MIFIPTYHIFAQGKIYYLMDVLQPRSNGPYVKFSAMIWQLLFMFLYNVIVCLDLDSDVYTNWTHHEILKSSSIFEFDLGFSENHFILSNSFLSIPVSKYIHLSSEI